MSLFQAPAPKSSAIKPVYYLFVLKPSIDARLSVTL